MDTEHKLKHSCALTHMHNNLQMTSGMKIFLKFPAYFTSLCCYTLNIKNTELPDQVAVKRNIFFHTFLGWYFFPLSPKVGIREVGIFRVLAAHHQKRLPEVKNLGQNIDNPKFVD